MRNIIIFGEEGICAKCGNSIKGNYFDVIEKDGRIVRICEDCFINGC